MLSSLRALVEQVRRSGFGSVGVRRLLAEVEFDLDEALGGGPLAWRMDCRQVAQGEPWDSLCREGVRRILVDPGVERWEVRALVEVLALEPPRGRDRRGELWLRELRHVRLDVVREAPTLDPDQGKVAAARRIAARRLLDPDAPAALLAPLPPDDVRLLCAGGRLDWLDEAVPLPELPPDVSEDQRSPPTSPSTDWHRFVHLALAAESAARPQGAAGRPPGIVLGCFDALLSTGDVEALQAILAVVEGSSWPEVPVLRSALLGPDRRRRLVELTLRGTP